MKLFHGRLNVILSCLLAAAAAGSAAGQESKEKPGESARELAGRPSQELQDLVRRTQDLAEQTRVELRRSREQNENLQRMLEQTHQELIQIRQEVRQLRAGMDARPSNTVPAAPVEKTSEAKGAQSAPVSKPDELDDALATRLARIEDQVEINSAQIKEQAQTKVESDSRFKVRLYGTVLNNTYFNTADGSEEAVPTAAPPSAAGAENSGGNIGSTVRQTRFGFAMTGPRLGGARLSADVDFDFFGGTAGGYESNALGALRMRTAAARLDGPHTSLAIGLMTPMISPLNPTSLAAVYYPALGESGNLWQWRPQITAERRASIGEEGTLILQGGLIMPFGETVDGWGLEGRPGYESRVALARRVDPERRIEIGVGGYILPQGFGYGRTVNSYAWTTDWLIPLHRRLEWSGEAYFGQSISLSEHPGGNIAHVFAFTGPLDNPLTTLRGIHSVGGWNQLAVKATPKLEFNFAFGIDDPRNRDVFTGLIESTTRLKNQTLSMNSIYRFRSNFLVALEYRRLWTTYPGTTSTSGHINLGVGYAF